MGLNVGCMIWWFVRLVFFLLGRGEIKIGCFWSKYYGDVRCLGMEEGFWRGVVNLDEVNR